jgi:oligo-1,6-glucosidase
VKAVWLNPVYDSPNDDMGYDIRNYEKIMAEFGSMADFDKLLIELHRNGIKLIMDLVVNHSSDEHHWFVESRKSLDNPYRDYYIWRKGFKNKEPNNWSSFFTPSAWKYDELTDEWFLHLFSEKQPDLNWENPTLRNEIYQMINRWFDKGVDGFRMDVINLIAKKPGLPNGTKNNSDKYVFSDEHFAMQPKLTDYLTEMRKNCFENRDCMCVGETPFVTTQNANSIVDSDSLLDMIFHFELMDIDGLNGKWNVIPFDVLKFKKLMISWQKALPWNSLFWSNHDQPRTVSRFGDDSSEFNRIQSAKMLGVCLHLLKGTSFIFQGEEIGMTNVAFSSKSEIRDIESIQFLKNAENGNFVEYAWNGILKKGRDNARTPMQWDDSNQAGFSDVTPWIIVNPNYKTINVASQMKDEFSVLHFYKKLITLKTSSNALVYGDFEAIDINNPDFFIYIRQDELEAYYVICNMTKVERTLLIKEDILSNEIVLANYNNNSYTFFPFETRVYKKTKR